ncbi:ABC transporter permease [Mesoplasma florum]|uniref:ABC transporter permease n=1 Tax=Mesoplasma florum TaxID=2151 RepID=UPI000BE47A64|nr:ABC transporter permease [Mesoplasma florum]ATI73416.1 ABC transporter permease [Mesoplasma florum]AVN61818.1 ABC transporter permease [Mesoplasma florum]
MVEENYEKKKTNPLQNFIKQKLIKYRRIPFVKLMKFSFKSLLKERLFYILNLSTIVVSILVGIILAFTKSGSSQVVIFNFYILFFVCCLMFVFILRMIQFFFSKNFEDKTTYIVLTNQVSRTKFFIAQYLLIILICAANILISFIVINLIYSIFTLFQYDIFILRMTSIYVMYCLLATFFLINFITFLIFVFTLQTTTIICTLLLALSFIANIPMSFIKANEKSYYVQFTDGSIFQLNDIYDAYSLYDHVNEGNIKYPHLSKYVYNYFLSKEMKSDDFSKTYNVNYRIDMWKDLGLINSNPIVITETNLNLFSKPLRDSSVPNTWQRNDKFNIQVTLNNTFITNQQLDELITKTVDNEIKNILTEFKDFSNTINKHFNDNIQFEKYDLFYDFLFLSSGLESSYLEKIDASDEEIEENKVLYALKKQDVQSFYEYAILGRDNDGFRFTNANNLVKNQLNFNLMYTARIIEEYFIKYSSNYIVMSSNAVSKTSGDWNSYTKGRSMMRSLSYFNLYSGLWMVYTNTLGFYNDDIWFSPNSFSKIYLEDQKNLFLGYPEYDIKLSSTNMIEKNTSSNYVKPWFYLIILFAISLLSFSIALYKFRKFDF